MKLIPRQLRTERFCYSSDRSVDQIISDLNKIFNDKQLFRQELVGIFEGERNFLVSFKIPFMSKSSVHVRTRLQGYIRKENDLTVLDVLVKPNLMTYSFFYSFLLFGLLFLTSILRNTQHATAEKIIVSVTFAFILPIVVAFYGQAQKNDLKSKLIRTLKLKPRSCL